jgi:phage terminase large subunit-like protein
MMTPFARILQKKLRNMSASEKRALCEAISRRAGDDLQFTWALNGRDDQLPPDALCDDANWLVWLLLGGRGAGKTRAGAEWVRARAMGNVSGGLAPARRIALVGPTFAEARSVMVEGVSGVLAVHRDHERPKSLKRLHWRNGAVAQLFSAEDPDGSAPSTLAGFGDGVQSTIAASYNPVPSLILFEGRVGVFAGVTEGTD